MALRALAAAFALALVASARAAAVDPATDGAYQLLGVAPIAAAHAIQLPCGSDQFLLMEFGPTGAEGVLMKPHPADNPDGLKPLWLWERATNSWKAIHTTINSICGGWAKFANGHVGLFSGHYQTLDYVQTFAMNRIVVYDATLQQTVIKANLTAQRWYPTSLMMPNGEIYVPGGTWAQKPNGTWPKAVNADMYDYAHDRVHQVPMNRKLWDAAVGNWYIGSLVLPSGKLAVMNFNMMQVIDPWSGEALAEAPPLAGPVKDMAWEFPRMGPQVMLRAGLPPASGPRRYEFMAFGGGLVGDALREDIRKCGPTSCDREAGEARPCSEYSVRIGLTLHADGRHEFDKEWEVERMPGPRCVFDGVLLPNGHVVLIGGQALGIGDLTNATHYNGGHHPYAQPWTYNPYAPPGERYTVLGARTKIARLYHAVAQLTSAGDILATGTSNAAFFETPDAAAFERTPLGVNEYRQEAFAPPFLFRAGRPARAAPRPPAWVAYGADFEMGFAFPDGGAGGGEGAVTGVVWSDPGGTTHNYAIGHRAQLLPFAVVAPGRLRVSAPPTPAAAPPGFYLVFLLAGDLYSDGAWVQIREPAPAPLAGVVGGEARLVAGLSSDFEGPPSPAQYAVAGESGDGVVAAPAASAAGAGAAGLRVSLASFKPAARARVASAPARLEAGRACTVLLWARGAAPGQALSVGVLPAAGGGKPALPMQVLRPAADGHCQFTLPRFTPEAGGEYRVVVEADLGPGRGHVDVDDVEVFCG